MSIKQIKDNPYLKSSNIIRLNESISVKLQNILLRNGHKTLDQIASIDCGEIEKQFGVGEKVLEELRTLIEKQEKRVRLAKPNAPKIFFLIRNPPVNELLFLSVRLKKLLNTERVKKLSDVLMLDPVQLAEVTYATPEVINEILKYQEISDEILPYVDLTKGPAKKSLFPDEALIRDMSNVSVRLKNVLASLDVKTFKELKALDVRTLEKVPYVGKKSLSEFLRIRDDSLEAALSSNAYIPKAAELALPDETPIKEIAIASVRLKNVLASLGVNTYKELKMLDDNALFNVDNAGRKTVLEFLSIKHGTIPLVDEKFMADTSDPILTLPKNYTNYQTSFIDLCRAAFEEYCDVLPDREADILKKRVWPLVDSHETLEALGIKYGISRERIRQLEKRLLKSLVTLFCKAQPVVTERKVAVKVCEEISGRWRSLVEVLFEFDEVEAGEFLSIVERSLKLGGEDVTRIISFAVHIFSQSIDSDIKSLLRKNQNHILELRGLKQKDLDLRIDYLRLGKLSSRLEGVGVATLGELAKNFNKVSPHYYSKLNAVAELILASRNKDGDVDLKAYCIASGAPDSPSYDANSDASLFVDEIERVVKAVSTWRDSLSVFRLRTMRASEERLTLQKVATEVLGSDALGPVIARIEKDLITKAAKALVYHDFSDCKIWVSDELLSLVKKAEKIIVETKTFGLFKTEFIRSFDFQIGAKSGLPHLLWSLIKGLPPNRYFHLKNKGKKISDQKAEEKALTGKIKLKGFKRIF